MLLQQLQQIGAEASKARQPRQLAPASTKSSISCTRSAFGRRQHDPCKAAARQRAPTPPRAAAAGAAGAPLQEQQLPDRVDPQQIIDNLSRITNYSQLAAFVQSQQAAFLQTPLCVYALLHAVQLRDTLSFDKIGQGSLASEEQVLEQFALVESLMDELCPAAVPFVPTLPLLSQATLALALAQLEYYDAPLINALSESVKALLSQPQQQEPPISNTNSSSSASSKSPAKAAALAELPGGLVPGVLLSLAVACSLNGHYDAELLDRVAEQAVAFRSTSTNPGPLISIAAALLDLQHDSPALLTAAATAAADAAADQEGALQPEEVISLLLALGFFRVAAPDFVELVLQALSEAGEQLVELDAVQLSRLWKALLLLRVDGVIPPVELVQAVNAAVEQLQEASPEAEDILQLGSCKGDVLLFALQDYKSGLTDANPLIRQQWEEAGLLAALELLSRLQESGYKLEQGAEVSAAQGLGRAAAQQGLGSEDPIQQQQQGEELPPAKVDLSFVLRDEQSGEERRVAVVLLFDDRYCNSPRNRLRGAAAVDILALQALGLAVLPLPLQEWRALGDSPSEQQRYLKARLAAATS